MVSDEHNSGNESTGSQGSGVTSSLTGLLKNHEVGVSTVKANKMLLEMGILAEAERLSSVSGKTKKYKVLTDEGLKYGENRDSAHSDQTSPYYYDNSFADLARLLTERAAADKQ